MSGYEKILTKSKDWITRKKHPEFLPENLKKIQDFRKEHPEIIQKIEKISLSKNDEYKILQEILTRFFKLIQSYEEIGYYKHLTTIGKAWLKYLEELATKNQNEKYERAVRVQLVNLLREKYRELEEWLERVDIKYYNPQNHNLSENEIESDLIEKILHFYDKFRLGKIQNFHNKLILKHIQKQKA